jgi:hypothetical protein
MVDQDEIEHLMYSYFEDDSEKRITTDDYVIDQDGDIHVNTHVRMRKSTPNRVLPVQFAVVDGSCILADMRLTSLRGAPHTVNGDFDCSYNALTTLQHAPTSIGAQANFNCAHNALTSLAHAPSDSTELVCDHNLLKNLTHAPACDLLWAPHNPFESFNNTPDHIQHVVISYAPHLPLLGLLSVGKIELEPVAGFSHERHIQPIELILNKYCKQGRAGMLKCAAELIRAGFKRHAYI